MGEQPAKDTSKLPAQPSRSKKASIGTTQMLVAVFIGLLTLVSVGAILYAGNNPLHAVVILAGGGFLALRLSGVLNGG